MTNLQKTVYCAVAGTFTAGAGIACIVDGLKLYHTTLEKSVKDSIEDPNPPKKAKIKRALREVSNNGLAITAMGVGVCEVELGKIFFKGFTYLATTKPETPTVENPTETNSENN